MVQHIRKTVDSSKLKDLFLARDLLEKVNIANSSGFGARKSICMEKESFHPRQSLKNLFMNSRKETNEVQGFILKTNYEAFAWRRYFASTLASHSSSSCVSNIALSSSSSFKSAETIFGIPTAVSSSFKTLEYSLSLALSPVNSIDDSTSLFGTFNTIGDEGGLGLLVFFPEPPHIGDGGE
mmetsp:Transcript_19232/g.31570  ORF Transcript_19232/g.31570 Transcript_19232/m.31570 type:complete len:181 (+) Transcript_19232:1400-1942(+)